MIFMDPAGAPGLACDECGWRWFNRMTGACYECGTRVTQEAQDEFRRSVEAFGAAKRAAERGARTPSNT